MHRRTGPFFFFFFFWGGGGGERIFDMFCPNRKIYARIRASPQNLAEREGGGGGICFARTKFSVSYSSIGIGIHAAPKIPDRIFARITPDFLHWQKSPPPPPRLVRLCSVRHFISV